MYHHLAIELFSAPPPHFKFFINLFQMPSNIKSYKNLSVLGGGNQSLDIQDRNYELKVGKVSEVDGQVQAKVGGIPNIISWQNCCSRKTASSRPVINVIKLS